MWASSEWEKQSELGASLDAAEAVGHANQTLSSTATRRSGRTMMSTPTASPPKEDSLAP